VSTDVKGMMIHLLRKNFETDSLTQHTENLIVDHMVLAFKECQQSANAKIAELEAKLEESQAALIRQIKIRDEQLEQAEQAEKVIEFYASPENWLNGEDEMREDRIIRSDLADYPHITRDVRNTGGKLARAYLAKKKEQG